MIPIEEIHDIQIEFEALKEQGRLSPEAARAFATRAADLVIEQHQADSTCLREAVHLICRIATDENPEIARTGVTALFPQLVERLNDSFDPAACQLYDQLFAQVIEFCRRLPEGHDFDAALRQFGLMSESDLLARKTTLNSRISNLKFQISNRTFQIPKKVLLLSRVTIGADVAVTSAIIAKLRQAMPEAEFVILGSRKLRDLYGGDERIRIHEISYERGGDLLARLKSWLQVLVAVNAEQQGAGKDDLWIIDPDSRLTQLGLLPLVENDHNYFFFESRSYPPTGESKSIGQLAAHWSGELIGDSKPAYPFIALPKEHQEFGQFIRGRIQPLASSAQHLVSVSFGVGGNPTKRVSAEFEQQLVDHILTDSKLILDKGATSEERDQINHIISAVRGVGKTVVELHEPTRADLPLAALQQTDVVTWDGSIGAFAGLIAASDQYIGYDSAGQHIAAALGIPTLTVFVNANNTTFAERWRPFGKGKIDLMNIAPNGEAAASRILSTALHIVSKAE